MAINAPGVSAVINTRALGQPAPAQVSDVFFVVGWALFGPVRTPTLITSWNEYVNKFGGFHANSEMGNAVYLFFKNGGRRVVVVREASPNAVAPFLNLNNYNGAPTIRITSKFPALLPDLKYTFVGDPNTGALDFTIESATLGVKETYRKFKITLTQAEQDAIAAGQSPFYGMERVNDESQLVVLTNLDIFGGTGPPTNLPVAGAGLLTGGADNIGNITSLDTALETLSELYGPGQIAAPGFLSATGALIAHAEKFKRIAIVEIPDTSDTNAELLAFRSALDSAYAAAYYPPRIQMRDFRGSGQLKSYSPTGAVAGIFAKAEQELGIHKAPANYRLSEVVGWNHAVYGAMNEAQREFLNEKQLNAIALFPEQGIRLYGARVLKSYGRITAIHEQRVLNAIYYRLKRSMQEFIFQPANQQLFRELRSVSAQYLRELYRSGALYSPTGDEDDAFRVICDETNNPPEMLQQHRVSVDVWVHLVGMAEMILLNINSVPLATDLDVLITGGEQ